MNLSDYARDTGVGVFSWGDVGLEKREAFEDAYVTVQGLWLGTHFTPNGTFSGSTPEGFEFSVSRAVWYSGLTADMRKGPLANCARRDRRDQ